MLPKGILKRGDTLENALSPHSVEWDEMTIAEHDLLRGTRTKIEEPNTPFMSALNSEVDFDEFQLQPPLEASRYEESPHEAEELQKQKELEAQRRDHDLMLHVLQDGILPTAVEEEAKAIATAPVAPDDSFAARRKAHYNEFEAMKAIRARLSMMEDEDDE
ncbi:MAG: uncharacterized protein KVP18_000509 [Porospora cf. gigantea A]|uniref:uncharacterized protein n=1 Tax=Porospora cf. gigantea A TaxID=2853593 RepID=UPI00355AABA9|nr:MAG: hypothetical protein KVP18_000509 [Porospora cf. gigantea A]